MNPPKKKTPEVEKPKNKGGRPKVQKTASSTILKPKKKNKNVGARLFTDPKTWKMYLNACNIYFISLSILSSVSGN